MSTLAKPANVLHFYSWLLLQPFFLAYWLFLFAVTWLCVFAVAWCAWAFPRRTNWSHPDWQRKLDWLNLELRWQSRNEKGAGN